MIIGMGFEGIVQDADIATPLQRSDVLFEELPIVRSLTLRQKELSFWVQFLYPGVFHGCCFSAEEAPSLSLTLTLRCYYAPKNFKFQISKLGANSRYFPNRKINGLGLRLRARPKTMKVTFVGSRRNRRFVLHSEIVSLC